MKQIFLLVCIGLCSAMVSMEAQEMVVPLKSNPYLLQLHMDGGKLKKTRSASLPFIDDFSYTGPYPNSSLWVDSQAYINNTMSFSPLNRGVATLDGLNKYGRPYREGQGSVGKADSLTSQPIDLSSYTPSNNVYLSFYVQPQGLGFAPEAQDSLFVYFKNGSNQWIKMWQVPGTNVTSFHLYFVPLNDTQFFHNDFQFRFVNIASLNINDDDWNIDYVKLDANRSLADSIKNDIGFTIEPGSILFPYTAMPYRHFTANQANEKSSVQTINISNLYSTSFNLTLHHEAKEMNSLSGLHSSTLPATITGNGFTSANFPSYTLTYTAPNPQSRVVVQDQYYFDAVNVSDRKLNDTIVRETVFDNYFAYDDGSAEKSYFLMPAFNFAAKTALKFHLNQADTLRGLGVHFGAQTPSAAGKYFSIVLYHHLGGNGLNDSIIHQEDLFQVVYDSAYNGVTQYAFTTPALLDSGTYYIGITQPANFGSDSIYYGLDVNNTSNLQYLFYNVDGTWASSTVSASTMIRPLVGQAFTPTYIQPQTFDSGTEIKLFPNPASDRIYFSEQYSEIRIYNLNGELIRSLPQEGLSLDISSLPAGTWIIKIRSKCGHWTTHQLIKS